MTVRTFGINGKSETPADYRLTSGGLLVPASALNGRTGVMTPPTITGTGSFTCSLNPFSCFIDGTSNSLQGGYLATLDTAATITFNTASTQARIDLIGLQIQDNDYDGGGQHQGIPVYVAGTPGSGSPPATPASTIALFTVPVAANASSVTFTSAAAVYPYTAAAGGIVPVRTNGDKPAAVNGVQYRHRLDVAGTAGTTSPLEFSTDGTTWHPVFDTSVVPASTSSAITAGIAAAYGTWTNTTIGALFSLGVQPQYRTAPGNRIELRGWLSCNSTVPVSSGVIGGLPLPSANRAFTLINNSQSGYLSLITTNNVANLQTNGTSLTSASVVGFDGLSYSL